MTADEALDLRHADVFASRIAPVMERTREGLAAALKTYWPARAGQVSEATLVMHLAANLMREGWHVYAEVSDRKEGRPQRMDLLGLRLGTQAGTGTSLWVEAKQVGSPQKARSAARDLEALERAALPGPEDSRLSRLPDGPRFGMLVAMTTRRDVAAWWTSLAEAPKSRHEGWRALGRSLQRTRRFAVHLYEDPYLAPPEGGWADNHLLWALRRLDVPAASDSATRTTPEAP